MRILPQSLRPLLAALICTGLHTGPIKASELGSSDYYPLGCFYPKGEQNYPIVKVEKKKILALVDGKEKTAKLSSIRFDRLETFAPGYIAVLDKSFTSTGSIKGSIDTNNMGKSGGRGLGVELNNFTSVGMSPTDHINIDLTLSTDQAVKDCYAAVFFGSKEGIAGDQTNELVVRFIELGELPAQSKIEKSLGFTVGNPEHKNLYDDFFVVFFSKGMPVRSSFDGAISKHFAARKQHEHAYYMKQYLENNPGKDLKPTPFYHFTPYLPEELYKQTGPIDCKVVFDIQPDGTVKTKAISGLEDEEAKIFLACRINEWLFFPELSNGTPEVKRTATVVRF
ncbi:hypothetical protein [Coraliomargarita parva]|uniref:hypothetical protein n=1 Tax=Coraliomargarita parva TaxID=3014050 RepID=UPI0022B33A85|nr:hypothetical protein [Coraliomargarita parva]